jgi:ABC-type nitrate/sulfonate/bicarbonate transport system permease component
MPRLSRILMAQCLFAFAVAALLQIACDMRWIKPQVMVSPLIMASSLGQLLKQGAVTANLAATLSSALQALSLAIILGVTGGALMHRTVVCDACCSPSCPLGMQCRYSRFIRC